MPKVLVVGAGASRGILKEKAPTADEFGEQVNDSIPDWRTTYAALNATIQFLSSRIPDTSDRSWALDRVWGAIDNRVKLRYVLYPNVRYQCVNGCLRSPIPSVTSRPPNFDRAGFELRKLVARIYGDLLASDIQNAAQRNSILKDKLNELGPDDCLVSFNYDVLVERIVSSLGKRSVAPHLGQVTTGDPNQILLCKPHGSLDWKTYVPERGQAVQKLDDVLTETEHGPDPSGQTVQAGIIAPVPFKEQIAIPETQCDVEDFFRLLVEQWRTLIDKISQADELVVMGYGFPAEDLHAVYLFGEAAGRRSGRRLEIRIYQRNRESYSRACRTLSRIFDNMSVEYEGPIEVS